jgi:hypothetical protein
MVRMTAAILAASGLALAACEERPSTRTTSTTNTPSTSPSTRPSMTPPRAAPNTPSPTAPSSSDADRRLADDIRKAIADDAALGPGAQAVTVTVNSGAVTLRGTLDTQAQKDAIEARVKSVAGVSNVDNQIDVKSP